MKLKCRLSPIALGLISCLVAVVVALVLVAFVHGIQLSGDLTYGDLLVGLGTFALAVLTAVLADATFRVDRRATEREERARRRQVIAAIRLLDAQLELVQRAFETSRWIKGGGSTAWGQYAEIVMPEVSEAEGLTLVRFFESLAGWQRLADNYFNLRPKESVMHLSDPDAFETLLNSLSSIRRVLRQLQPPTGSSA